MVIMRANAMYISHTKSNLNNHNVDVELDGRKPYAIQNPRIAVAIDTVTSHHPPALGSALATLSSKAPGVDGDDDVDAQDNTHNENENEFENTGLELVKRGTGEPKPMSRRRRRKKYRGFTYDPNS
ncbi:hypothetical protein CVT24_002543 [Panaeolus cyanescens]|uniref:Uncharacterized protein n=1 Tax=Panaeolus cyanescens TaxID=181874 RepID=A0A409YY77_9AGAR|nr:hypothetical protein CVT24_002543 [Panaeolus cyanescens]